MRSILLALFILVAPLPLDGMLDDGVFHGQEVVLALPEGSVWSQSAWDGLEEHGYAPLRLATPSVLVAWQMEPNAGHPSATEYNVLPALFKSVPFDGQRVKLVFEPGLPDSVNEHIRNQIQTITGEQHQSMETGHLASVTVEWEEAFQMHWFTEIQGILWIEPLLETLGRNLESAQLLSGGEEIGYPAPWRVGLNGSEVVIGVADTGIDSDHSCFQNRQ